ncbi:DUF2306 domain-containing protein [Rickettsia endosymbiont of Ceutorhynchus obstrictus]
MKIGCTDNTLKNIIFIIKIFFIYAVMCISCVLMLNIILGYSSFENDVQFLLFKKEYIDNKIWKTAFYIHVFSAIITLFAGFSQFSKDFLKRFIRLHRIFGKIYVVTILVINFPVGMILAIYANGGLLGKIAFVLLDFLWFVFTYKAFINVREKKFIAHKFNMMRSYALTFSAITLRAWHAILSTTLIISPYKLYIIEAWLGFMPNLLVIEFIIWLQKKKYKLTF